MSDEIVTSRTNKKAIKPEPELLTRFKGTIDADAEANEINAEHELAQRCAGDAIKHGIRCGELLMNKKKTLPHGTFMVWVETHCEFKYSTAARYMKLARESSTSVEISALSHLFPSGRPGAGLDFNSYPQKRDLKNFAQRKRRP